MNVTAAALGASIVMVAPFATVNAGSAVPATAAGAAAWLPSAIAEPSVPLAELVDQASVAGGVVGPIVKAAVPVALDPKGSVIPIAVVFVLSATLGAAGVVTGSVLSSAMGMVAVPLAEAPDRSVLIMREFEYSVLVAEA
jgi:hypothetical protein